MLPLLTGVVIRQGHIFDANRLHATAGMFRPVTIVTVRLVLPATTRRHWGWRCGRWCVAPMGPLQLLQRYCVRGRPSAAAIHHRWAKHRFTLRFPIDVVLILIVQVVLLGVSFPRVPSGTYHVRQVALSAGRIALHRSITNRVRADQVSIVYREKMDRKNG